MARRSIFEDLMDLASRLPWAVSFALAALSGAGLHALGAALSVSAGGSSAALGGVVTRSLYGTIVDLLQFVIPLGFLFGAVASFLKRSKANSVFLEARSAPERTASAISWTEFERLVGEAFRRRGYDVTESGGGGSDGGVDLVLVRGNQQFLVQCKQWRTQRVGVTTVRELYGVIAARQAAGGFVVTSGEFTHEAAHFAQDCGVELVDGKGLASLIRELDLKEIDDARLSAEPHPRPDILNPSSGGTACPECGSTMKQRTAKRGPLVGQDFFGCTRYPACRGIRRIAEPL
jgi:restriction system protein